MNKDRWDELKQQGSSHYKVSGTEPIDLYQSGDMFQDFALASIIKYAFRSRKEERLEGHKFNQNMGKIIHYAQLLMAHYGVEDKP
jgi:hypothetical protein